MTDLIRDKEAIATLEGVSPMVKKWDALPHTDWETQNLGFTNSPQILKAVLLRQDYQIKELSYELALASCDKDREETPQLKLLCEAYEAALIIYKEYANSIVYADKKELPCVIKKYTPNAFRVYGLLAVYHCLERKKL